MLEQLMHKAKPYAEIIINSLDLLSFILVTPEVLRIFQSSLQVIFIYLFVYPAVIIIIALKIEKYAQRWSPFWKNIIVGWGVGILPIVVLLMYFDPELSTIYSKIFNHSFSAGVILFFVSRLLAVLFAL